MTSSDQLRTATPVLDYTIDSAGVTQRIRDIYRRFGTKPDIELVEVTAVGSGLLTVRKIGTTTTIAGVIAMGWSGSMLPAVGEFVWTLTPSPGATPFAIGTMMANNPRTKVYQNNAFNLANNTFTIFAMDINWLEEYDQMSGHSFVTNNTRITIARSGIYQIEAAVTFGASGTGARACYVAVNGTTVQTKFINVSNAVFGDTVTVSLHKQCGVGDYVEFGFFQNSGGALACIAGVGNTYLSAVRIGDLG